MESNFFVDYCKSGETNRRVSSLVGHPRAQVLALVQSWGRGPVAVPGSPRPRGHSPRCPWPDAAPAGLQHMHNAPLRYYFKIKITLACLGNYPILALINISQLRHIYESFHLLRHREKEQSVAWCVL